MKGIFALKLAYVMTWVIQFGYIGYLLSRFKRVREENRPGTWEVSQRQVWCTSKFEFVFVAFPIRAPRLRSGQAFSRGSHYDTGFSP